MAEPHRSKMRVGRPLGWQGVLLACFLTVCASFALRPGALAQKPQGKTFTLPCGRGKDQAFEVSLDPVRDRSPRARNPAGATAGGVAGAIAGGVAGATAGGVAGDPSSQPLLPLSRPLLRADWFFGSRLIPVKVPGAVENYQFSAALELEKHYRETAIGRPAWKSLGPTVVLGGQIGLTGRAREVAGPVTAITVAQQGDAKGEKPVWLAGAAAGGIWRSEDRGQSWSPGVIEKPPGAIERAPITLAIGALAVGPAGSIYAGTGNAYLLGATGLLVSRPEWSPTRGLGEHWRIVKATVDEEPLCGISVSAIAISPEPGRQSKKHTIVVALNSASPLLLHGQKGGRFGLFAADIDPVAPGTLAFRQLLFPGKSNGTPGPGPVTDLKAATVGDLWCLYVGVQTRARARDQDPEPPAGGLYRSCTDDNGLLQPWTYVPVLRGEAANNTIAVAKIAIAATGKPVYASLFDGGDQLHLYRSDKPWDRDSCSDPSDCWKFVSLYDIAHEEDPDPVRGFGYSRSGYCNWNPASPNPQQPGNCKHSHTLTVDPSDPNTLYAGGIALWKCTKCGQGGAAQGGAGQGGATQGGAAPGGAAQGGVAPGARLQVAPAQWEDISYLTPRGGCHNPRFGIHVDQQAMAWAKESSKGNQSAHRLIVGNDGGVWSVRDPGAKSPGDCVRWENHNFGLDIAPTYGGALDPRQPGVVFAGAQDIGTIRRDGGGWRFILGGDGVGMAVSHKDPARRWLVAHQSVLAGPATKQLALQRTRDAGLSFERADLGIDRITEFEGGPFPEWVPPLVQCPDRDSDVLLLGLRSLWKVKGLFGTPTTRAFETASPPTWKLDYFLNADDPNAGNITAAAFAPDRGCETYAIATRGLLHVRHGAVHNIRGDWKPFRIPVDPGRKITSLAFEPTGKDGPLILYSTVSTYGDKLHVFRGPAWKDGQWLEDIKDITPLDGGKKNLDLPFSSIAFARASVVLKSPEGMDTRNDVPALFAGSDFGVWISYDRGEPDTWCWFTPDSGLPSIPVTDLKVHPATNGVYAFTFGRGVLTLPDVSQSVCECRKVHGEQRGCVPG